MEDNHDLGVANENFTRYVPPLVAEYAPAADAPDGDLVAREEA